MKSVVIRAPLLSVSGYGEHSRQVYKFLLSKSGIDVKTQIVQWGNTAWCIDENGFDGLVSKIMSQSTNQQTDFDVSFQVQLPDEWSNTLAKFNVGITAGVETDICNPAWIDSINKMDLVIVPSNHAKTTFLRSGVVKTPIEVVGEWYQESLDLEPLESITSMKFDTNFNFLVVSQLTSLDDVGDRKNIFNTLRCFCNAFENDPNVGLILKTNLGRGTQIDRENVYNVISQAISHFRKGQYPKIHVLHGNMTDHEIASIYRHPSIKCFINLTRGEGFGIPILDASVAGLPVITTNWSGHLDFMNLGKFVPVDYKLVNVPQTKIDNRVFIANSRWAEPDEQDFRRRLLKFRNSSEVPKTWALDLSRKCKEKFSRKSIELNYSKLLERNLD
jgi:glycosyltransferase involved in cell wall biosynthesis